MLNLINLQNLIYLVQKLALLSISPMKMDPVHCQWSDLTPNPKLEVGTKKYKAVGKFVLIAPCSQLVHSCLPGTHQLDL